MYIPIFYSFFNNPFFSPNLPQFYAQCKSSFNLVQLFFLFSVVFAFVVVDIIAIVLVSKCVFVYLCICARI